MYLKECRKTFTYSRGRIEHNNAPGIYLPNENCTYTVKSPKNLYITLYFTKFDLEYSRNCENDYILITEGSGNNLRYVGKYCGSNKPTNFRTGLNVLTLRFVTNSRIERNGFRVTYYFQYKPTTRPKTTTTIINPIIIDPLRGKALATTLACILMEFVLDVHNVMCILMECVLDVHTVVCILLWSVLDVYTVVCMYTNAVCSWCTYCRVYTNGVCS